MAMDEGELTSENDQTRVAIDLEAYKMLLQLWSNENWIKTAKLQVLLGVNALFVSALSISGGFTRANYFIYLAGAFFNLVWTFSIGRTCLFQDMWQVKLEEIQGRHSDDPRFGILKVDHIRGQTRRLIRFFGGVPSKWYLLFTPVGLTTVWVLILFLNV